MSNTKTWPDPDTANANTGNSVGAFYQIDPTTNKAVSPGGGGGGGAVTDTFGNATNLIAATTFSGVPTISQLAANSSVLLANPGDQATFLAQISVASAFVGTLSFYGLEADGATLQPISAHLRNSSSIANNTAINTASALNQVWVGNIANFKAIYVVCTAFTSGSVSVQLGLSAAPYAVSISNTVNATITNGNSNGQATMGNSAPVVIASDQSPVATKAAAAAFVDGAIVTLGAQADAAYTDGTGAASGTGNGIFKGLFVKLAAIAASVAGVLQVKRAAVAVYSLASTTTVGATQNSGDLTVGAYTEIALDINVTAQAGTSPTLQFFYERKGADGIYYPLWQTNVLTAATQVYTASIGAGMIFAESLGSTGRLRWVVGGSATPTFTFSANITGK